MEKYNFKWKLTWIHDLTKFSIRRLRQLGKVPNSFADDDELPMEIVNRIMEGVKEEWGMLLLDPDPFVPPSDRRRLPSFGYIVFGFGILFLVFGGGTIITILRNPELQELIRSLAAGLGG